MLGGEKIRGVMYLSFYMVRSREEKDRHGKTETKKTGPEGKNEKNKGKTRSVL